WSCFERPPPSREARGVECAPVAVRVELLRAAATIERAHGVECARLQFAWSCFERPPPSREAHGVACGPARACCGRRRGVPPGAVSNPWLPGLQPLGPLQVR